MAFLSQLWRSIELAALRYAVVGELAFLGGVGMSILVAPEGARVDDGLSIFSVLPDSFIPFTAGLLIGATLILRGALLLPHRVELRGVRELLMAIAVLMAGVAFTPFNLSPLIGSVHKVIGISTYVTQFTLAAWLMATSRPRPVDWPLFVLLALSALTASLSLDGGIGYSFQGQLTFQVVFSVLVLRALYRQVSVDTAVMRLR